MLWAIQNGAIICLICHRVATLFFFHRKLILDSNKLEVPGLANKCGYFHQTFIFSSVTVKSKALLKIHREHFGVVGNIQVGLLELLDGRDSGT